MPVLPEKCQLLRVHVGERYTSGGMPLYEAIVLYARREKAAGATCYKGIISYGHTNLLEGTDTHGNKLSDDMPVIVDIVDTPEKVRSLLPHIKELMGNIGLVTISDVSVVHQGRR